MICSLIRFSTKGTAIIIAGLDRGVDEYARMRWPIVEGRIVQSEIRIYKDKGTSYCPILAWEYVVQGEIYKDSNDTFCLSQTQAQSKIAKFPMGARVSISYSPQDPGISAIAPGISAISIIILLVGVVFIVIAFYNM